jgi:hypothetical protein
MPTSEAKNITELNKKVQALNLIVSHTKRSTIENGKGIEKVQSTIDRIHNDWIIVIAKLTGDDGYFKQTKQNTENIELQDIKLSKQDIRLVKILVFGITAGLIMGWLISQYRMEQKAEQNKLIFYNKPKDE